MTSRPAWWLPGPHVQTLWPVLARRVYRPQYRRERWELPDGDFLDLDLLPGPRDAPFVLVLHGLEGSSDSGYARGLLGAVLKRDWRGGVLHFRNCSATPNRLRRSYCAGVTDDLDYAVWRLRDAYPQAPLAVVGYSLGGSVLLKWLGEQARQAALAAAAAISVPFLLADAASRVKHGFSRLYQWHLTRAMQRSYIRKFKYRDDAPFPIERVGELNTFFAFDDAITAPLHGYDGVDDYYRRASCRQYLKHIETPTLILHARDDPFMYPSTVPKPHELGPGVKFELSAGGGHVGFVGGAWPWRASYWLEQRIPEFLTGYFSNLK